LRSKLASQLPVGTPQQAYVSLGSATSPLTPSQIAHNFGHPHWIARPQFPLQQPRSFLRV
jgi:hypothetical protein